MNKDLKEKLIKKLKEAKIPTDVKIPEFYLRIQNIINNCPEPCLEYLEIMVNEDKEKIYDRLRIHKDINFTILFSLYAEFGDVLFQNMRNYMRYNSFSGESVYKCLLTIDMFINTDIIYSYLKTKNIIKLNSFQREILFSQIFYNEYLKIPCFIVSKDAHTLNFPVFQKSRKNKDNAQYSCKQNSITISERHLYHSTGYQIYNSILHELVHLHQKNIYSLDYDKPDDLKKRYKDVQYCDIHVRIPNFVISAKYLRSKNRNVYVLSNTFYYINTDEIEANNISRKKSNDLMLNMNDYDIEISLDAKIYNLILEVQYEKFKTRYHIAELDNNMIQSEYNYAIYHLMHNENPESYLQAMIMYDVMNIIICQAYIDAGLTFDEDRFKLETMNAVLEQYGFSKENFQ